MYSQHFGLTQDPFSIAPDPRYLFMSERHREALAHLLFGVAGPHSTAGGSGGGFVLLTGDIGTGKTTICRCFLEQIPAGCHVAYIFNPKLTVSELLQSICEEFHVAVAPTASAPPTVKDYIDALNAFLLQSHAAGQSSVLIIDEAQNLQPDVLEQLRLLTNLETSARKLLQIVLIGQPELRSMLQRAELEQLAQRVIARFHLDALTEAESVQYIQHRLAVAGHTGPLPFERAALKHIHRLARGVPRRINLLCGRALLGAWANGLHTVNRAIVAKAADEVFGPLAPAPGTTRRAALGTYLLGGTSFLLGAALVGVVLFARHTNTQSLTTAQHAISAATPAAVPAAMAAGTSSAARPALAAPMAAQAASASSTAVHQTLPNTSTRDIAASSAGAARAPVEALDSLLAQLPTDIGLAWGELATRWGQPRSQEDACAAALQKGLLCYRTNSSNNLSFVLLRQLGRPGILTLQADKTPVVYAVLVGLSEQTATLQTAGGLHVVSLMALGRMWHGEFATLWQAPAGYSPAMRSGSGGPAIQELARQLALLDGHAAPTAETPAVLDDTLRERVRDFQRAQGLRADGQPGPITFMQLESATGTAPQPRLLTDTR